MTNINTTKTAKSFEELYLAKDYKGAVDYLIKNKKQYNSGIFHYNLGTVYSKLGEHALSRYHLEKAINIGYVTTLSINNLNYVKTKLAVDDLSNSSDFFDQTMNWSLNISPSMYLTFSLILMVFFTYFLKRDLLKKPLRLIVLIVISLLPISYNYFYVSKINSAIVFKDIPVFEGPSKIFQEKGKVKAGSKIVLGEYKEGWFFIKYPVSLAGWVTKDQLGFY